MDMSSRQPATAGTTVPGTWCFLPASPERWADLEKLFGRGGASGGCWCMYWRMPHGEFRAIKGEGHRQALKALIETGGMPGLLAYDGDRAVGWCSFGPRQDFPTLRNSRMCASADDQPVWSIVCFFVASQYRRQGMTVALLRAAVGWAREHGATIVEGYPVEPSSTKPELAPVSGYTGLASAFRQAGFVEVARRSETRVVMRHYIAAVAASPRDHPHE
jgi:GNAT superfamily N-acetyltransferase